MPRKLTEIEVWEVIRKTFYKANVAAYSGSYMCKETCRNHLGMCSIAHELYKWGRITETVKNHILRKIQATLVYDAIYLYDLDEKGAAKRRKFCKARIKELENGSGNARRNRSARTTVDKQHPRRSVG
jgi:hypothetical protein